MKKTILITGVAGFIGFHTAKKLLKLGHLVIGIDNLNKYYDVKLKYSRLKELGVYFDTAYTKEINHYNKMYKNFIFRKMDLSDHSRINDLFSENKIDVVCHLAAQAGVRYSLENPGIYIKSNIVGFYNILESCKKYKIPKLVYASSSSVYGNSKKIPFSESDMAEEPVSLYAATKKSNELIANTYSNLHGIETIGLRFFTVYGPWGRPDMALFLFVDAIFKKKSINIYNKGNLSRDFTYIDDIVYGVNLTILKEINSKNKSRIYNIGKGSPIKLLDFIDEIEKITSLKFKRNYMPMQAGDVFHTYSNTKKLVDHYNYQPSTNIKTGIDKFIEWYKNYYEI